MAIKDNKSNTDVVLLANQILTTDGSINTISIDGFDYDNGITFVPSLVIGNDVTTVTITEIQDSPDDSVWSTVPSTQIIGNLSDFIFVSQSNVGDILKTLGVIGTERYVRLVLETSGYTTNVTLVITVNAGLEVVPGDD